MLSFFFSLEIPLRRLDRVEAPYNADTKLFVGANERQTAKRYMFQVALERQRIWSKLHRIELKNIKYLTKNESERSEDSIGA